MVNRTNNNPFTNTDTSEEILGKSHKYYVQAKCELLLELIKKLNHHPKEILDLGCGAGIAEDILQSQAGRIVGLDLSQDMAKEAKNKKVKDCEFACGDALKLPFRDDSFDLVFSFCLFHHLPSADWASALKEIKRVTRKGGMFVVCEHNPDNLVTRVITKGCPIDDNITLVSPKKLERLCKLCGIKVLQRRFIVFFPEFLSFLRRLERFLFRIPVGGQYMIVGMVI